MRQKGVPARLEQDGSNKQEQVEGAQGDSQASSWSESPDTVAMPTEAASSHASTDEEESSRPETMGDIDCSQDSWFVCEHCRSLFETPSGLAAHVEEHHTVVLSNPGYWRGALSGRKKKTITAEERRRRSRERMREKRNNMTEEEREMIREKARLAKRNKFHNLAHDKKEKERERARVYMRNKRMTMTEEERDKVREKARLAKRLKTATMPKPEKEKMKEKARVRMRQKRDNMTEAQRETMREKARLHARQRRLVKSYLKSQGQSSSGGGTIAEDLMAALKNWEDTESNTSEDTVSAGNVEPSNVEPSQRRHEDRDLSQNMLQFHALNTES